MQSFLAELRTQRWDDHRYYHHSRINQSLHLLRAISFIVALRALASPRHARAGNLLAAAGIACYAVFFGGLLWLRFSAQYCGEELSESQASERSMNYECSKMATALGLCAARCDCHRSGNVSDYRRRAGTENHANEHAGGRYAGLPETYEPLPILGTVETCSQDG